MSTSVSGRRTGHRVRVVFGAVVAVVLLSVSAVNAQKGSFTDPRDGKKYRTVRIGNLTWMAKNLNYATPSGSFCYDDDLSNCAKYGRLYDWKTAMKACPAGWRLPGNAEWNDLVKAAGGNVAGKKLKARSPAWNGTDDFGFSALPGGGRFTGGNFDDAGSIGHWWSATEDEDGSDDALGQLMHSSDGSVIEFGNGKGDGYSVLCVQD